MTDEDEDELEDMLDERFADQEGNRNASASDAADTDEGSDAGVDTDSDTDSGGDTDTDGAPVTAEINSSAGDSTTSAEASPPSVGGIDPTDTVSIRQLAAALMADGYHRDDPPVPYAMWRDGSGTGRTRTSIELNRDLDTLVAQAQTEFNRRHDVSINRSDLRELAMAYGLVHLDEIFDMAKEWGLQYDN